jgi:hypothetical protein
LLVTILSVIFNYTEKEKAMSNANARLVSYLNGANRLSKSVTFKLGYEDYIKARPFNYEIPTIRDATDYERGRSFAIWCKANNAPRSTWRNGVAAKTVIERIVYAMRYGYVI